MAEPNYEELNKLDNRMCLFDKGEIIFSHVKAKYPTKTTLAIHNLNLKISSGEKIGIVGQTGSGKSTVIKLLSQYLTQKEGKIIIDGYDIRKLDLQILRSQFLLLSQEVALFNGSIKENIFVEEIGKLRQKKQKINKEKDYNPVGQDSTMGNIILDSDSNFEISDQEIIENMIEFGFSKEKLEKNGLNFQIENNGGNLSQGEQQLVALMKALYTPRKIIILDEATSNIDYHSEKKIMDFFYDRIQGKTLITVAHRLNTVLRCDRILVLEQGKVVESGTTKDLLADESTKFSQLYQKMTENID